MSFKLNSDGSEQTPTIETRLEGIHVKPVRDFKKTKLRIHEFKVLQNIFLNEKARLKIFFKVTNKK